MGRTFLGSEFEIKEEEIDALAAQAGHSITISHLRYASEVGKLPSMSSNILLCFGKVPKAWWEHTGFKPGCIPLFSLCAQQELQNAASVAAALAWSQLRVGAELSWSRVELGITHGPKHLQLPPQSQIKPALSLLYLLFFYYLNLFPKKYYVVDPLQLIGLIQGLYQNLCDFFFTSK